jgi:FHA domain
MPLCPAGHDSAAADYCDLCGIRMDGPSLSPPPRSDELVSGSARPSPNPPVPGPPCPRCGVPGLDQFCESCGYAATSGVRPEGSARPPSVGWTAVVGASRTHYAAVMAAATVGADDVPFPDYCPERTVQLKGSRVRIGRRSASREQVPEIDLTGPPADPGVSRLHAILVAQPDGTWAVIDPGSENGTTVNDVEIETGQTVPLRDGDSLGIGAWTSITIIATGG